MVQGLGYENWGQLGYENRDWTMKIGVSSTFCPSPHALMGASLLEHNHVCARDLITDHKE